MNESKKIPSTKEMSLWDGYCKKTQSYFRGFTLTELIVVISILAILGLIAFMSLSGYVSSARDATRASDISNLFRGMEISIVKNGVYPTPDNAFTVTYSGGSVWSQGTAGDGVFRVMDNAGVRSSKKFTDPLLGTEYGYATLAYGKAYQFRADWEGDTVVRSEPRVVDSAYGAPGNPTIAYIKGNYAGYMAKTLTGGMTCILAVPSLIVSQSGTTLTGSVDFLSLTNRFLMNGQSNIQGVKFTPQPGLCLSILPTDDSKFGITNIMTSLRTAYSGSDLASNPSIFSLLTAQSGALVTLGIPIIEASLNIDITGTAYPDPSVYSSGTVYSPTGNSSFIWSGTTVHVTDSSIGFASSRADPLCDTNDIAIWSGTTNNVQIWSACNVGATVALAGTTSQSCTAVGCSMATFTGAYASSLTNFGSYFQWGNNAPVTYLPNNANTTSRIANCAANNSTYSGATNFVLSDEVNGYLWDWCNTQNDNLWWDTTNTMSARKGPCPTGYHVPTGGTATTATEWWKVYKIVETNASIGSCKQSDKYERLQCVLMLPYAGFRIFSNGLFNYQGLGAYYWSSSPDGFDDVYVPDILPVSSGKPRDITMFHHRATAFPVRCIKN